MATLAPPIRHTTHRVPIRTDGRAVHLAPIVAFLLVAGVTFLVIDSATYRGIGVVVMGWLGVKQLLAAVPARGHRGATPDLSVGVVITVFNETPAALQACLVSLARQTYPPSHVVVVDDHSQDLDALRAAERFAVKAPFRMTVLRQPQNMGKREALARGYRAMPEVDVFFGIDSDTELVPDGMRQGVRAFGDPRVVAVTGAVLARNASKNLLTMIESGRYAAAFYGERAAQSRLGSVLCVSGAVAFWRADAVRAVMDTFTTGSMFGIKPMGEDRFMTDLLLSRGRVVFAPGAVALTDVPERLGHYARQQARWGRSFWVSSAWLISRGEVRSVHWWLNLTELALGTLAASNYLWAAADVAWSGTFNLAHYAVLSVAWAYARNAYVFGAGMPTRLALGIYAVSAANVVLSLVLTTPIRLWSLATARRTAWGTRSVVEIPAEPLAA